MHVEPQLKREKAGGSLRGEGGEVVYSANLLEAQTGKLLSKDLLTCAATSFKHDLLQTVTRWRRYSS